MRITPEIEERINELYAKNHNKSLTAKLIGCSASTVSKYIKPNYVCRAERATITFDGEIRGVDGLIEQLSKSKNPAQDFCDLCMLSDSEWKELKALQKSF